MQLDRASCVYKDMGASTPYAANQIHGEVMNNYGKVFVSMGLLSLLSASPLTAQLGNGLKFNTPFPFYVGNAKMPAGS